MEIIKYQNKCYLKSEKGYQEILATTDSLLNLPQPSKSFIEKYVQSFNSGNPIEWVNIEYERVIEETVFINGRPASEYNRAKTKLKVDKNNEITISKIKDSWSREEVIELLTEYGKFRMTPRADIDDFIKQNL